jgi:hypothetical protein
MKSRPKDYWRYKIGPKEYGWTSRPGYGEHFVHISVLDEANRVRHYWEGKYNEANDWARVSAYDDLKISELRKEGEFRFSPLLTAIIVLVSIAITYALVA